MVYLTGLLPNPDGPDAGNEWVGLNNDGGEAADLYGWYLEDNSGASFQLNELGIIRPAENIKVVLRGMTLNNGGDKVVLFDRSGAKVDELEYGDAVAEGEIVFSPKTWTLSETAGTAPLANVLESGVVGPSPLSGGVLEPLLLGLLAASLGTGAFIFVWHKIYSQDG